MVIIYFCGDEIWCYFSRSPKKVIFEHISGPVSEFTWCEIRSLEIFPSTDSVSSQFYLYFFSSWRWKEVNFWTRAPYQNKNAKTKSKKNKAQRLRNNECLLTIPVGAGCYTKCRIALVVSCIVPSFWNLEFVLKRRHREVWANSKNIPNLNKSHLKKDPSSLNHHGGWGEFSVAIIY